MSVSIELLMLLFLLALFAGAMDTLVGGGGLITVPGLMLTGLPPVAVLGTNKLQGCSGTATASLMLFRRRHLHWKELRIPMLMAALGATIGALLVRQINSQQLQIIIPVVLSFISIYFLLSPMLTKRHRRLMSKKSYNCMVLPLIGLYDGMLGPGTGSFYSMAASAFRQYQVVDAVKRAKALNFATNAASLTVFIGLGEVIWHVGLVMVAGQIIGAWIGTHTLFKINPALLRPGIVIVSVVMLISYLYNG